MSLLITRAIQNSLVEGLDYVVDMQEIIRKDLSSIIYIISEPTEAIDGIDFAASRNWDTREKAILYGSKYLLNNYITKGQDSLLSAEI